MLQTFLGMARARVTSGRKNVDGLVLETRRALRKAAPDERFVDLSRLLLDAKYHEKREPRRARVLRAALLDLCVESLGSWSQRDPELREALSEMAAEFEGQRREMETDAHFDQEVDLLVYDVRN